METERRTPLLAGRYRLVDRLGSGGMGVVWRAIDEVLDREVAAKEVRAPEHLREEDVRVLYARLKQEARAAARVSHPNVITVHDVVEQHGRPWIVMELVRGRSLADVLETEGVLSQKETARVGAAVLRGLRGAHASGVLHRDVKPANVLLADGGRVVLTDFGIALVEGSGTLTRTGDLIGSPDYLAPERALGERPGAASDLWSLGTTLYAAVEGVSPFRRTSALSTLQAVVQDDPPPPRRAGPLTPLLEGLLRKDPRERMGSAEALELLDGVATGRITEAPGPAPTPAPGGYVPTAPAWTPHIAASASPASPATPYTPSAQPTPSPRPTPTEPATPAGPAGPGRGPGPARRRAMWVLVPVLALLLIAGGIAAAVYGLRESGSGQAPGPSESVSAPATQTDEPTDGPSPGTDPTGYGESTPTPTAEETPSPTPEPTGTCKGGWVTSC
ncbi:protein kinase [Streptomyces sp. NPDC049577]|uniref:serine/threonine-protein kinase n=1 Tax=Streptomyces sp. NPDC049577 TaxID=3155153 RepID=UPI00344182F3